MGRKQKYNSDDEKKIAKKQQWMKYYERNKDEINKKRMEKYYENKGI